MITKIVYFVSSSGVNPVKEFIDSLENKQKIKVFHIFKLIIEYGINSIPQHIKKLSGTPLWEISRPLKRITFLPSILYFLSIAEVSN